MGKFKVLHWSENWMMDGLETSSFDTLKEAQQYVLNFRGDSRYHKRDSYEIVETVETGKAERIDKNLYGFRK